MTVSPRGRVVIVGTGVAGATAAETLRKEGFAGPIVLIGADPAPPYRRPMVSKELLTGAAAEAKALLKPRSYWDEMSIELTTATAVSAIDPGNAHVELSDGSTVGYNALILATGGKPRRLDSILGDAHTLRHMHDVPPLRAALARTEGTPSLIIVGGGLVGMEVAAAARESGAAVTVLEMGSRVLERLLPERVSAMYERMHRDRGVAVHTGVRLADVQRVRGRTRLVAADGRDWSADVVVTAVGMDPDDVLAERAGLDVHDGILVDEFAESSAPGVYAAGDVARFPDRILGGTVRIEHWNHAQAHGAAAARSILGIREPYAEVPWCWTTQFGRNLQIAGYPSAGTETIVHGDLADGALLALVLDGDRLVGAAGAGRPRELRAAKTLIKDCPYVPSAALRDGTADLVALAADAERYAAPPTVAGR